MDGLLGKGSDERVAPPAAVLAVYAAGLAQSLFLLIWKPYATRRGAAKDAVDVTSSTSGRADILLYFRLYSFFHCLIIAVAQLRRAGTACLYFYTVWSYWLLILFFGLASVASFLARLRPRRVGAPVTPDILEYWVLATYHVTATTVLIVDSVAWLVLMPMLSHQHPSPDANWRKLFFCWTGYNQHGVNALMMLVETLLNRIPVLFHMLGFVGLWSCAYGVWAYYVYASQGRWIYPFLDYTQPGATTAYFGLFATHWVYFLLVQQLKRLKDRSFPKETLDKEAKEQALKAE